MGFSANLDTFQQNPHKHPFWGCDTIPAMQKNRLITILLVFVSLILIGWLVYQLPPVNNRLSWRIDFALAYLRGVVDPVEAVPTALPTIQDTVPAATATPPPTATAAPPTATTLVSPTPTLSPTPLPPKVSLPPPAYEKQDMNNCGPAALTMYLRFYGWEGDQTDITELLKPYREDRNVNVEELDYYVRTRAGWLNIDYRVGGDLDLLKKFLAAGIPVMIEESFYFEEPYWPNDDLWAAHYQLLTGYDDASQTFIGQDSFHGPDQVIDYQRLDEYWQVFNRVYILVYLPHQEETVKAILGPHTDADYNRQHALEVAEAETEADPENAFAWFNLGTNLVYFENYLQATIAYDKARQLGLPQRMFRYQFGPFIAYFHSGKNDEVLALTDYALQITPNSEEAWLWRGWALYRQGETGQAIEAFEQALEENPVYLDAQYALDFVRSQ
jgi:tetratricopeptide (TPR) repeat protein